MIEDFEKITVETLPNGYGLSVGNESYMYLTTEKFVEGFMYHVCLGEQPCVNVEAMREFLAAAVEWRVNGSSIKEVIRLRKENETLLERLEGTRRLLELTRKRLKDATGGKANVADVVVEDEEEKGD